MTTTGGFSSIQLLGHEAECLLPQFSVNIALAIGELAASMARERNYSIVISIRMNDWEIFKEALPGTTPENDNWARRKANVVNLTHHSTMFERVKAEEEGINWHEKHGVEDATHAIHGGGFPLATKDGYQGVMLISGLPQVDDHNFAVDVLKKYLGRSIVTE